MHDDEVPIDEDLVHCLLADQLPGLADLPVRIVEPWGTDNAIWRIGEDLVVRLPRIGWAAGQADKEARWLPDLAPPTHRAIDSARHLIDADDALTIWEEALAAPPHLDPPVWMHGDLEGNCLAISQACAALPYYLATYPLIVERCRYKLAALGVEVRDGTFG